MAIKKALALTKDGRMTYCSAPPEKRGQGRCNHLEHQNEGESEAEFLVRISDEMITETQTPSEDKFQSHTLIERSDNPDDYHEITQEEIDQFASQLDELAGQKLTLDNFEEVLNSLPAEKIYEIASIGFKAAPMFSLPITDENFDEKLEDNLIYFSDLARMGIAGKEDAVAQIFGELGDIRSVDNGVRTIHKSYLDGISEEDQFHDIMTARDNQIQKSVATSKPGAFARLAFYGTSDVRWIDDCGSTLPEKERNLLNCRAPGNLICKKCAEHVEGGPFLTTFQYPNAAACTSISEILVTFNMKVKHNVGGAKAKGGKRGGAEVSDEIISTFSAFKSSKILQDAVKEKTTAGRRRVIFEGISRDYDEQGKHVDDANIMLMVKKMTSYRRDEGTGEWIAIKDPEKELCEIRSMKAMGMDSNIFKRGELQSAYKFITNPQSGTIQPDAAMEIDR